MEKKVKLSILLEIYGKLLTEKQLEILTDYYNNDLSLSEIAENNCITRQAVLDNIKKGENKLFEIEEKLLIMEKMLKQEKVLQEVFTELAKLENVASDKKVEKILNHIRKELSCVS